MNVECFVLPVLTMQVFLNYHSNCSTHFSVVVVVICFACEAADRRFESDVLQNVLCIASVMACMFTGVSGGGRVTVMRWTYRRKAQLCRLCRV